MRNTPERLMQVLGMKSGVPFITLKTPLEAASQTPEERGTILIIAAGLIVVWFVMASLSIDITRYTSSREDAVHSAKFAALGALQQYFQTHGSEEQRLAAALQGAQGISGMNRLQLSKGNRDQALTISLGDDSDGPVLEAGKVYYVTPERAEDCSNPCQEGTPPCFVVLDQVKPSCESGPEVRINAFRVRGQLYDDFLFYLPFWGDRGLPMHVEATATVAPRRLFILVDISPSMTSGTHAPPDSKYALFLSDDNDALLTYDDEIWASMPATRPEAEPVDPRVHYQSDYTLISPLTDADYNSDYAQYHPDPWRSEGPQVYSAKTGNYRVDTFRTEDYAGPEPLTWLFDALKYATETMKDMAVAGDKLGIIFYESTLSWPGVINLTDDFDYLLQFADLKSIDAGEGSSVPALIHGLFPSYYSYTDMIAAISEAMRQFAEEREDGVPAQYAMINITDGLQICTSCSFDLSDWDVTGNGKVGQEDYVALHNCIFKKSGCELLVNTDFNGDGVIDSADWIYWFQHAYNNPTIFNCYPPGCGDTYDHYAKGISELKVVAREALFPSRIPIHTMLIGEHIAPHTLDIAHPDDPARCLTDQEARILEIPFVRGQSFSNMDSARAAFNNMGPDFPFLQANLDNYQISVMTGGLWAPIRRSDADCDIPCDPGMLRISDCRPQRQQVLDIMKQILANNPYIIFDAK